MNADASILLADVGNARVKWGLLTAGRLRPGAPMPYRRDLAHPRGPAHEAALTDALEAHWTTLAPPPVAAWVSNTAGAAAAAATTDFLRRRWAIRPRYVVAERARAGICNAYAAPERLGSDRWLCLIATAKREPGRRCCIVDCGTAIAIDLLDADGDHRGGLILPGVRLMMQSLVSSIAALNVDLPHAPDQNGANAADNPGAPLGVDTPTAIANGALQGAVAAIDGIAKRLEERYGTLRRILTGGDGARLLPHLRGDWRSRPHLVLEGLACCALEEKETPETTR